MPYDEAERTWKIRIYGPDGKSQGLIEPGYFRKTNHGEEEFRRYEWFRTWFGKAQGTYTEILYQQKLQDEDGSLDYSYFLLYRFDRDNFTDDDYGRSLTRQQAAEWLIQEKYDLPDDLREFVEIANITKNINENSQDLPLPDSQQEIWDLLENHIFTAKELATRVLGAPISDEAIRKRIQAIRKSKRKIEYKRGVGYYRPDAPPSGNKNIKT